jgi:hypothetical protein
LIRTVITLLIVAAALNALVRAGMVAVDYYELRDEAQQIARFGSRVSEAELSDQILEKAMELELPVEQKDILVSRSGSRTQVEVSYRQDVELFPRFIYPVDLSFAVEALSGL